MDKAECKHFAALLSAESVKSVVAYTAAHTNMDRSILGRELENPDRIAECPTLAGKPMIRRLFTVAAVLSLMLCVLTAALSITSYRNPRVIERNHFLGWLPANQAGRAGGYSRIRHGWVMLEWGRIDIGYGEVRQFGVRPPDPDVVAMWNSRHDINPPRSRRGAWWARLGFECQWDPDDEGRNHGISMYAGGIPRIRRAGAPLWALMILAGTLPATWLALMWRRKVRTRQGRCGTCGYDLRASADRCPECGRPINVPTGSAA